jgi:hypothetical protein
MLYFGFLNVYLFCEIDYYFTLQLLRNSHSKEYLGRLLYNNTTSYSGKVPCNYIIQLNISDDGWNDQVFGEIAELRSNGNICKYTQGYTNFQKV